MYTYPPVATDLGDSFNYWTTFNPVTTADMTDGVSTYAYSTPQDWNTEFDLKFSFGMEPVRMD
jgi:hypothetical protein